MDAFILLPRPVSALKCPGGVDALQSSLVEFDRRLDNLRQCVHWLVEHDVKVLDSRLGRAGGIVKVAPALFLRRLLGDECGWRQRRFDGARTIYTWFGIRFGTRIEWEDVCAH